MSKTTEANVASEEMMQRIFDRRMSLCRIPPELMEYSMTQEPDEKCYNVKNPRGENSPTKIAAYEATVNYCLDIHKMKGLGKGIFFYGEPSKRLGMSLLSSFILRVAIEEGYSGVFVPFSTICSDLDYSGTSSDTIDLCYEVDFLVIDAISKKSIKTAKVVDGFADIIITRRNAKRPTIFASYINPDQFCGYYSECLLSYLDEFVETYEIRHEAESEEDKKFDMDRLIHYLQESRRNKLHYTGWELEELLKRFKKQYVY